MSAFLGPVLLAGLLLAPHHTATVTTPDVALGTETLGTRTAALPVLAVNGGPGLAHTYMVQNDLWDRVARHRLVVFYDQRGTGASKALRPGAPQTMAAQIADLEAVRAAEHLDRFALLGDSYGGFLALAYAVAHPEHVAKLILSDSPGSSFASMVHLLPQVFPDIEEDDAREEKALGGHSDRAAQAGLRNHFRMIFDSPAKRDAYLKGMGDLGYVPQIAEAVSAAAEKLDLTPKLASLHVPTLVLNGRWDMNVAPLTAWRLAHAIPGAKLVFFEQSGHLPSYEEPARYLQVLEDFLGN